MDDGANDIDGEEKSEELEVENELPTEENEIVENDNLEAKSELYHDPNQNNQNMSVDGDPRLTGMDYETYQYWAQQGYSHDQIVDWWKEASATN